MKKICLSVLTGMMILLLNGGAFAGGYSSTTNYLNNIDHGSAYTWGINFAGLSDAFSNGEEIIEANLIFNDIRNWTNETSKLYVSILDFDFNDNGNFDRYEYTSGTGNKYRRSGVYERTDTNNGFSDYFLGSAAQAVYKSIEVSEQTFDDDDKHDVTISLADYLDELNEYAATGIFGLGFDPDCHFYMCGVTIQLKTGVVPDGNNATPEPATLMLFGAGLLGLASRMRKKTQIA